MPENVNQCPYCDYVTPEPLDGDAYARGWQEYAHMSTEHRDVISARLGENVMDDRAGRFSNVRTEDPWAWWNDLSNEEKLSLAFVVARSPDRFVKQPPPDQAMLDRAQKAIAELNERVEHVAYLGNPDIIQRLIAAHLSIATDREVDRDERREAWMAIATIAMKQATG